MVTFGGLECGVGAGLDWHCRILLAGFRYVEMDGLRRIAEASMKLLGREVLLSALTLGARRDRAG